MAGGPPRLRRVAYRLQMAALCGLFVVGVAGCVVFAAAQAVGLVP